jgi:hypothetical protein
VNDLMRQRIGIQQALAQSTTELTAATAENSRHLDEFKDKMGEAASGMADGFATAAIAALDAKPPVGPAKHLVDDLRALPQQRIVELLDGDRLRVEQPLAEPARAARLLAREPLVERLATVPGAELFTAAYGYVERRVTRAEELGQFLAAVDDLTWRAIRRPRCPNATWACCRRQRLPISTRASSAWPTCSLRHPLPICRRRSTLPPHG